MDKVILDEWDVIETLSQKIFNIGFVNEDGDDVYVADVERTGPNKILITTTDGAKLNLTCSKAEEVVRNKMQ